MILRCCRCGRSFKASAVEITGNAWGPKCARIAGLVKPKREARLFTPLRAPAGDPLQMDLLEATA